VAGLVAGALPEAAALAVGRNRLLRRLAGAVAPPGVEVVSVLHGPVEGARLELEVAREKAFWLGVWEPEIAAVIAREACGVSWDLGAHIGYFSLLMARRCDRVVAVEASPSLAARLRRNIALNAADVTVVEAAVAGAVGTADFELSAAGGMSRVAGVEGVAGAPIVDRVRVETTTLDRLLESHGRPAFAKLDVEGAELEALQNAPRFLAARPVIVCDLHGARAHAAVPELLRAAGYDLDFVQPSCLLARPAGDTR
jgi:FkbM family methyltransferase